MLILGNVKCYFFVKNMEKKNNFIVKKLINVNNLSF